MENAASALKMGAAILIFIIAIGTSFSLFGTAKQTADSIITMRDKQKYLEAAELDGGILYTSSEAIQGDGISTDITKEYVTGVTTKGDRVVEADDVISTIYRYSKEKYGITIVQSDGKVLARFDSGTESIMALYKNIKGDAEEKFKETIKKLNSNTKNDYITNDMYEYNSMTDNTLYGIYDKGIAPWYGNNSNIEKRIICDIYGGEYEVKDNEENIIQKYEGKKLIDDLIQPGKKIIEVTNEIDESTYLYDEDDEGNRIDTNLLQQHQMPTIEIIYIIY